jgi:anti-sigma B factor antagonist
VVIDLSRLNRVGAALLGELIRGLTTVRNAGGELKLSGVSGRVDKTLRTTRLYGVLKKADPGTAGPDATASTLSKVV